MLLLPRIDLAYQQGDPEVLTELDALIETTSERQNVLVAATTVAFEANSDLDNIFGIKLGASGAKVGKAHREENPRRRPANAGPGDNVLSRRSETQGLRLQGSTSPPSAERILEM